MDTLLCIAAVVGLIVLGWPPFLYRRFSHDGRSRPLGRAIFWSACFYFGSIGFADLAASCRAQGPELVAAFFGWFSLLLVLAPLPFNLFAWAKALAAVKNQN
jgi:hypothetical protein